LIRDSPKKVKTQKTQGEEHLIRINKYLYFFSLFSIFLHTNTGNTAGYTFLLLVITIILRLYNMNISRNLKINNNNNNNNRVIDEILIKVLGKLFIIFIFYFVFILL